MKKILALILALLISNPAFAVIEKKTKVSSNDTTAGYLNGKLAAGSGVTFTENNDGGNESLTISTNQGSANGAPEFLYIEGSSDNNFETILGATNPTADHTIMFPDADLIASDILVGSAANTLVYANLSNAEILIGDGSGAPSTEVLSGDVTMANTGAVTIAANSVALGTDTTGNYLATIADAGNSTVTISGSGSETAAITIDAIDVNCSNCIDGTDIALGSDTTGDVMYYDGTNWVRLAKGTNGQFLKIGASIPEWATPSGAGDMLQATYDTNTNNVVDTATALAANGTDCSAGSYARGVDASGNAEHCTVLGSGLSSADIDTLAELDAIVGDAILASSTSTNTFTNKTLAAADNVIGADTAVALAANGNNCSAGEWSAGVDASGVSEGCTADDDAPDTDGEVPDAITVTMQDNSTVPNGAAPTADAAGEVVIDTTANQLLYYGSGVHVASTNGEKHFRFNVEDPTDLDDNIQIDAPKRAITITDVYCEIDGGTSVALTISDGSNALEAITCDDDGAEDDGSIANGSFTARERMEFDLASTSGVNTNLFVEVTYTEDRV